MKPNDLKPGLLSVLTALGASACCVLPLTVAALGVGSGAFMLVTMPYRPVLYPLGVLGLSAAFFLHFRERRRCSRLACRMAGGRTNAVLLAASTVLMVAVTYVDFFLTSL